MAPIVITGLVHTSVALHAVATGFFLSFLFRFRPEVGRSARRALAAAVVVQAIAIVVRLTSGEAPDTPPIHAGLFFAAFVIDALYLLVSTRRDVTLFGAFVVPITTAMLLAVLFVRVAGEPAPDDRLVGAMIQIHVVASVLGVLAFALSFGASAVYLVGNFGLRAKKGPGWLSKLPPLSKLERLSHRLLLIGFPIYTLGVLLGTVWLARSDDVSLMRPQMLFAGGSWVIFATLLHLHSSTGWRGARAAILNMVGFLLLLLSVMIYALRGLPGA